MTRVDGTGVGSAPGGAFRWAESGRHDAAGRFGYGDSGSARSLKDGLSRNMKAGHFEPGERDRDADFRDRFQRELKKDDREGKSAKDDGSAVLLAVAGEGMPLPSLPGPGVSGLRGVASAEGPKWVEQLFDRIEQSVQAEMRTSGRHQFSLHLDLQNAGVGMAGLQISMTETSIDVVFLGSTISANAAISPEVEALADRLRTRFSRKVVRIHEVRDTAASRGPRGLGEISELLVREGRRT